MTHFVILLFEYCFLRNAAMKWRNQVIEKKLNQKLLAASPFLEFLRLKSKFYVLLLLYYCFKLLILLLLYSFIVFSLYRYWTYEILPLALWFFFIMFILSSVVLVFSPSCFLFFFLLLSLFLTCCDFNLLYCSLTP